MRADFMSLSRLLLLWFGLWLLPVLAMRAEVVDNLYQVEVPVADQERDTRTCALTDALLQVLMRVSGRDALALMEPGVEQALVLPTRYVERYRYAGRQANGERQLLLQVRFEPEAVNRILRDNRLPVWGRNRPGVLAWVVIDDRRGRKLLASDSPAEWRERVAREAANMGLPLRLPLYDLTDRARLTVADVWGNFEDRILDASRRYQVQAVLVGKVYKTYRNRWRSHWTLYNEGRRDDWASEGASLDAALAAGIAGSTRQLAERYARVAATSLPGVVRVRVVGIRSLADYARAVRYLAKLDGVTRAAPDAVGPDAVLFSLASRSGQLAVSRAIELGHTLIPETPVAPSIPPAPAGGNAGNRETPQAAGTPAVASLPADLVYRLVP